MPKVAEYPKTDTPRTSRGGASNLRDVISDKAREIAGSVQNISQFVHNDIKSRGIGNAALGLIGAEQFRGTFEQLRESDWDNMSYEDEEAFVKAQILSIARPIVQYFVEQDINKNGSSWKTTGVDVAGAVSDFLDGHVIRGQNYLDGTLDDDLPNVIKTENDAKTSAGAFADEKSDKLAFLIEEFNMARRGELPAEQAVIRAVLDLAKNYTRDAVYVMTNGQVDVSARDFRAALGEESVLKKVAGILESGKIGTLFRSASNKLFKSPLGELIPERVKEIASWAVTAELGFTAAKSIGAFVSAAREWSGSEDTPVALKAEFWQDEMETAEYGTERAAIQNILNLTADDLKMRGIQMLAIDIDNTLIGYGESADSISSEIVDKLIELSQNGIMLTLASNTKNPTRLVELIEIVNKKARELSGKQDTIAISGAVVPESAINRSGEEGIKGATPDEWRELIERAEAAGAWLFAGGHSKPQPDIFTIAAQRSGIAPIHAAAIGDQPMSDIDGAKAAGYRLSILTEPFGKEHLGVKYFQRPVENARKLVDGTPRKGKYPDKLEIIEYTLHSPEATTGYVAVLNDVVVALKKEGLLDQVQIIGGLSMTALGSDGAIYDKDSETVTVNNNFDIGTRRFDEDGNYAGKRDIDILVTNSSPDIANKVKKIAKEAADGRMKISVFGVQPADKLKSPNSWHVGSGTVLTDRYETETEGQYLSSLSPAIVSGKFGQGALESWTLKIGGLEVPISRPATAVIDYLKRFAAGAKKKDAEKIKKATEAQPDLIQDFRSEEYEELRQMVAIQNSLTPFDGIEDSRIEILNQLGFNVEPKLNMMTVARELLKSPAFGFRHEAQSGSGFNRTKARLGMARLLFSANVIGIAEDNETFRRFWQRSVEPMIDGLVKRR